MREILDEVRLSARSAIQSSTAPSYSRLVFDDIQTQIELATLLEGSTWRKRNNVEHVIFAADGVFYNNHAGHPTWRKNTYKLGSRLGSVALLWKADGIPVECRFNQHFTEFVELHDPTECRWSLIATEPHTPSWGI